jgi:sugar lactone lactonase YvrE
MPVGGDRPSGGLYRFEPDGSFHRVDEGYIVANGPALSHDGQWLYHTDTGLGLVYRFRMEEGGSLGEREIFIRFQRGWGKPDGMTVDTEGGLWIAHWGGARVSRFSPEGELERSIALPASQITNVCFAGPELDRMFVTSAADQRPSEPCAGALFEVEAGVRGLAPHLYAG